MALKLPYNVDPYHARGAQDNHSLGLFAPPTAVCQSGPQGRHREAGHYGKESMGLQQVVLGLTKATEHLNPFPFPGVRSARHSLCPPQSSTDHTIKKSAAQEPVHMSKISKIMAGHVDPRRDTHDWTLHPATVQVTEPSAEGGRR